MKISMIAAMDEEMGIGRNGKIPWHVRADLRRFRKLTLGHFVIFGRRSWESIRSPLPGRKVIVLSKTASYMPTYQPFMLTSSLERAVDLAYSQGETNLFIAGGESVYNEGLEIANFQHMTYVKGRYQCDRFYPFHNPAEWYRVGLEGYCEGEMYYVFETLQRLTPGDVILADNVFFLCAEIH